MNAESTLVIPERSNSRRTEIAAPAQLPADSLLTAIERVASNPQMDIERMRELVNLKRELDADRARRAFDAAIAAAKAEIKPIIKKREVDFTSSKGRTHYMYEDLAAIAESVDPILAAQGLSYRHRAKQEGKKLTITCVLSHRDGHFEETSLSADYDESGNKNSIQGVASTATYLQRYTLKLALGLSAAKDDDAQKAESGPGASEKQLADLRALIESHAKKNPDGSPIPGEFDKDCAALLKKFNLQFFDEIPEANFDIVRKDIELALKARDEERARRRAVGGVK